MIGRIVITDVSPVVSCGRWPAKTSIGETVPVTATVFREGHDLIGADVVLFRPDGSLADVRRMRLISPPDTARYQADVVVDTEGVWSFHVQAWADSLATWRHAVEVKAAAGQGLDELAVDLEDGALLLERVAKESEPSFPPELQPALLHAIATLRNTTLTDVHDRLAPALAPGLAAASENAPLRDLLTADETFDLRVDRERALYSAWYEFVPRSEGSRLDPKRSGTFADATERLPAVADMGFDVVYLPPIHPIGEVNRKGPNNTLNPDPSDPGSPWAIGSKDGGHDAVHPDLGSLEDFDAFVARAGELGMEVALDLALQAAPDHPWAKAHPEWFTQKSDGSIAYAENPPKKYQDIYPINFDRDPEGIYREVLRIVRHWTSHGVRIFRVDNPHTKPVSFWERLIAEVKSTEPDVLFLAEAFTRPPMMHMLGMVGFSQSYTYFTWRTEKWELEEYGHELVDAAWHMRPNFFVNTPDILHASLQYGGPPVFKLRAVLASMMSSSWGVYSGYELFEHVAVRPGSEEYLDSEKYQYRPRDWSSAPLTGYLTRLNQIRREHPALHQLRNLRFHASDNESVICFSKRSDPPRGMPADTVTDTVLVVVNLDPHATRETTVRLDMPGLGMDWTEGFDVHDEITGTDYAWGQANYVRLDPFVEPAHIFTVRPRR
ncbi:MAG TPA: alpha-1,4-glucan--maltose-1-phosphate maltosyltransferase [Frankiaceae bacterium]|nr:alpha-1,4-glucan--maltose-1-phosphate maltosyltransferase [Frankiaceae bacterium]